jgi:hypothetical protein
MTFDYAAQAELYPTRSYKRRAGSVKYKRFEVAAEAVRFAMEELRMSFSWALILRSKNKGSTASKFACCMRAEIIHFLASCPLGAHFTTIAARTSPSARWPKTRAAEISSLLSEKHGISCAEVQGLTDRFGTDERNLDRVW